MFPKLFHPVGPPIYIEMEMVWTIFKEQKIKKSKILISLSVGTKQLNYRLLTGYKMIIYAGFSCRSIVSISGETISTGTPSVLPYI